MCRPDPGGCFKLPIILFLIITIISVTSQAATPIDYLILQDIGSYIFKTQTTDFITGQPKTISGYSTRGGSGILAGADHFSLDHTDTTYETDYINRAIRLAVEVQITQHSGSDSDRWLLHEVERDFRTYYGLPGESYVMRVVDGNNIMAAGSGGWDYRWLSGNKVIQISYDDLMMEKLEPLEVVKAYLVKHPSTLTPMTSSDLRTSDNEIKWTKDEMDRRLWLCDKWFEQLQLGKADQKTVLQEAVKSMNVFLDYREKYYGMAAKDEKNLLDGYLSQNDETNIRAKLREYKDWWSANKSGSLIGMITSCPQRLWGQMSLFFGKLGSFFSSLFHKLMGLIG